MVHVGDATFVDEGAGNTDEGLAVTIEVKSLLTIEQSLITNTTLAWVGFAAMLVAWRIKRLP
jgi:hypothetical protein